ncbi:MAG: hypothetical protein ACKVJE_13010 [Pseudomonadales bacterium]
MKTTQLLISTVLALVLSFVPQFVLAKDELKPGVKYHNQGALQEIIKKGGGYVMIDNIMYKVASYARIVDAGSPVKLRHLDVGVDVEYSYKKAKKSDRKPVITAISVIMK